MVRATRRIASLLALAGALAVPAVAGEITIESRIVPETKAVFGLVRSQNVVPARARIGGTIREIGVSEGDEVAEGATIATVVDDKLALELDAARSRLNALNSQLENARTELERNRELRQRGVTSQARLDQAQTQFDVANNQVAAAGADIAVVEQRAREGAVLAPATGRILSVPVTLGSVILPGDAIARVATGQYYLRLALPERHAAEIAEGGTVSIGRRGLSPSGDVAAEAVKQGRIVKVYPEISDGRVIADVEVAGIGDYFVGERTLVRIPVGTRPVLAVPPEAVRTRHGIDYVSLAGEDGGGGDVAVILGETIETADGPRVEILTGVKDGDRILVP